MFWIGFPTFSILPLLALALNLVRCVYARAEMDRCADAAAAQEVDVDHDLQISEAVCQLADGPFGLFTKSACQIGQMALSSVMLALYNEVNHHHAEKAPEARATP